ncbi:hypothetical protein [Halovenus sp. HT40]|uniref:hypothetical protein n=1 Tax=Halovenus sp. HT40 TaxID=3126691 RepID=UPI00300EB259
MIVIGVGHPLQRGHADRDPVVNDNPNAARTASVRAVPISAGPRSNGRTLILQTGHLDGYYLLIRRFLEVAVICEIYSTTIYFEIKVCELISTDITDVILIY